MVVVYIYDLEYIEAEELVRGTVFDGEDVESYGPTVWYSCPSILPSMVYL